MEDNSIYEMIAAFAAGCMDKANYIQVKDYLDAGGELPQRDLGELQNIVSMIPVILELEQPSPEIKDMVAKKLIGIKDEIKAKLINEKRRTASTFTRATSLSKTSINPPQLSALTFANRVTKPIGQTREISDEEIKRNLGINGDILKQSKVFTQLKEPETNTQNFGKEEPPRIVPQKPPTKAKEPEPEPQPEKTGSNMAGWIALLLTIILFTVLGYYSFTSVESLRRQIDDLKAEVTSLQSSINTSNNFMANYNSLVQFFNYNDIVVVNLVSPNSDEKGSAKLLFSFNEKEGLIQFQNVKMVSSNQVYQVWMINRGQAYSLGVYRPTGLEYLKITSFPFLPKEQIDSFKVTVESEAGATTPSQNVYLVGSFSIKKSAR
jgi:hypothetical protein